ncbi:MAG: hypothetical protein CFH10_00723 [Alphaproteobacteria bacterium MarineAlpha4_Bin2]|nr:MAG: hypothetical protein CFH10_00723 [Alphaproteobacteria bacterium MarineAlpha4_Bin2]
MKNALVMLAVAAALGLSGCATSEKSSKAPAAKKAAKACPVEHVYKASAAKSNIRSVFKKGSKVCSWTDCFGNKGTDYFYKDKTAMSGSADRVVGKDMKQGTWQITGAAMNTNWYGGKKGKGRWYKVAGTGKKSFQLTTTDGAERYSVKCK